MCSHASPDILPCARHTTREREGEREGERDVGWQRTLVKWVTNCSPPLADYLAAAAAGCSCWKVSEQLPSTEVELWAGAAGVNWKHQP